MVSHSLLSGGLLLDTTTIWTVIALLLGSALFWIPLVRHITSPLRTMRDAAQNMARGHFDTRVQIQRGDEIGSLANSLNNLGEQLEDFVTGQKRFLGDIAHELGSPLARMQFALGIVEQNASPELIPQLEDVREEVGQMSELLGEILQFTKAGLHSELHIETVPLLQLVNDAVTRENIPTDSVHILVPKDVNVHADRHFLLRAIANILRNAIRYAGDAGPVLIESRNVGAEVHITFSDNGPGVPEHMVHRLCDPFFRTESARTRETGGVGLGLAIVKRCVEACSGLVVICNRTPHGLTVELKLPATNQAT
jgi:two-component system sensor histidine kinase CpxA